MRKALLFVLVILVGYGSITQLTQKKEMKSSAVTLEPNMPAAGVNPEFAFLGKELQDCERTNPPETYACRVLARTGPRIWKMMNSATAQLDAQVGPQQLITMIKAEKWFSQARLVFVGSGYEWPVWYARQAIELHTAQYIPGLGNEGLEIKVQYLNFRIPISQTESRVLSMIDVTNDSQVDALAVFDESGVPTNSGQQPWAAHLNVRQNLQRVIWRHPSNKQAKLFNCILKENPGFMWQCLDWYLPNS